MVEYDRGDLVCLYLAAHEGATDDSPVSRAPCRVERRAPVRGHPGTAPRRPCLYRGPARRARSQPDLGTTEYGRDRDGEAVVDRLPEGRAGEYHRMVADVFVDTVGGDAQAARIAHHYEQAGEYERAIDYCRRGGGHASETLAYEDAIGTTGDFDRAQASARDGFDIAPETTRINCHLGDARAVAGEDPRAFGPGGVDPTTGVQVALAAARVALARGAHETAHGRATAAVEAAADLHREWIG